MDEIFQTKKGGRFIKWPNTQSGWMTLCVCLLIISQIALIGAVLFIVTRGYRPIHRNEIAHIHITYDTDSVSNAAINNKAVYQLDSLANAINRGAASNIDMRADEANNGFTAIMLAMITLCATMAVVIPYVVGKSISMNDIKTEVAKYDKRFDVRIDKAIKKLEWSEAHNSRMIAYLLLHKEKPNPDWAIGWASKSLIRYLKQEQASPGTENFCEDCLEYIKTGFYMINHGIGDVDPEHKIRAIKDAYDALGFAAAARDIYKIDKDDRTILINAINTMLLSVRDNSKNSVDNVLRKVVSMSKYKEYMGQDTTDAEFIKKFKCDIGQ